MPDPDRTIMMPTADPIDRGFCGLCLPCVEGHAPRARPSPRLLKDGSSRVLG